MEVNRAELRRIANEANDARERERQQRKNEERDKALAERKAANDAAEEIIASIPDALKKAASHARRNRAGKGRTVVAKIAVVNERLWSIMDSSGCLSDEDEQVLKAVRRKLRALKIAGVEIALKTETHEHTYQSADGLDSADGPCTYYYIEARTHID